MRHKKWFRVSLITVVGLLVIGSIGLAVILRLIDSGLEKQIAIAVAAHTEEGDTISALSAYVNSNEHSLAEKNRAVWALGRLHDPRALPLLVAAYTGEACDHERSLCQSELEKAIARCEAEWLLF